MAIKLQGVSCDIVGSSDFDREKLLENIIICGGIDKSRKDGFGCYHSRTPYGAKTMESRCRSATADSAFMFLTALTLLVVGTLVYLRTRK